MLHKQLLNSLATALSISALSLSFLFVSGCGGSDEINFSGTWDGSFSKFDNNCPFTVNQSLGDLFPMTISEDGAGVFTVRAANGDTAVGGQGIGETISFTAEGAIFGSFGSSAPFVCTVSPYQVSYLEQGDNAAAVNVFVTFSNCATADNSQKKQSCSIQYSGDATKR